MGRAAWASWLGILSLALQVAAPHPARAGTPYTTRGACGGFPAVGLASLPGTCLGLVAANLGFPRGVAVIGDTIYVADMGGWTRHKGRLLRLANSGHDKPEILLSGLDEPSGLLPGPNGTLYIGVLGQVLRFDPANPAAPPREIVSGLPGTGRHPLTVMAAGEDGALLINVGSGTDHCEGAGGRAPDPSAPCPEANAVPPRGAIYRVTPDPARAIPLSEATLIATGLRNSMAMALLPSGALVAAVNARDAINEANPALSDEALPHDTFDIVTPGANYGWPYCFDLNRSSPEYPRFDCGKMHAPTMLLPPHAAPLGMLRYQGAGIPGLAGQLVIGYHGYRKLGHRIVAMPVAAIGRPRAKTHDVVWHWEAGAGMPQGAPVALAEMSDGSVLITEDQNGTLLRLTRQ